jgi:hypothetical protein
MPIASHCLWTSLANLALCLATARFDRVEAAMKALVDMEGRFFGGRVVRASFFDEDKFDRNEYAPMAGEFD